MCDLIRRLVYYLRYLQILRHLQGGLDLWQVKD